MDSILDYLLANQSRNLEDLKTLLRFPSVSTNADFSDSLQDCAAYLVTYLKSIGLTSATMFQTAGHPIVYADYHVDDSLPTVLLYGHYDVQPADPYDLWNSDPFEPTIKNGYIFARGVSDDKGQFFCHIKAIEAWLNVTSTLPVNVKLLIEGEEEIGSPNLASFISEHKNMLKADVAVISDTPMINKDQPALCYSLRGMVYAEIVVTGPSRDLHSGQYGGIVQNPIQALSRLIASLKDSNDKVLIPGFYDAVRIPSDLEATSVKQLSVDLQAIKTNLDIQDFVTDPIDINKQLWLQPTLDCNGIVGGYIQPGAKTIIPSQASAKVSMRLVSDQHPETVFKQFKQFVMDQAPLGVRVDVQLHTLATPAKMNTTSRYMQAASAAFQTVFGQQPVLVGEGGTIPVVADFKSILDVDTVMMGFNCPDDCIHSPNERFLLDSFYKGIQTTALFFHHLS